jgi:hypothetical protein
MSIKKSIGISILVFLLFFSFSTSIFLYIKNINTLKKIPEQNSTIDFYDINYKVLHNVFKTNIESQFSYIDPNTLINYDNKTVPISSIIEGNFLILRIPSDICDCFDSLFSMILDFKKQVSNIDLIIITSNSYDFRKFYGLRNANSSIKIALLIDKKSGFKADEDLLPTLAFYDINHRVYSYYSLLKNDTTLLQTFLGSVQKRINQ